MKFAVLDHKGRARSFQTFRGAKSNFSMLAWRAWKKNPDISDDDLSEMLLTIDRKSEWDVRRLGAIHALLPDGQQISLKSMIA